MDRNDRVGRLEAARAFYERAKADLDLTEEQTVDVDSYVASIDAELARLRA